MVYTTIFFSHKEKVVISISLEKLHFTYAEAFMWCSEPTLKGASKVLLHTWRTSIRGYSSPELVETENISQHILALRREHYKNLLQL